MTSRGLALIWGVVLFCAALVLVVLGQESAADYGEIPVAPVIVVGSSLMWHAVAPSGGQSLLGDGRPHGRLQLPGITEQQTIGLLDAAVKAGARTVLLEANSLAFDFASRAPVHAHQGFRAALWMQPFLELSARARALLSQKLNPRREAPEGEMLDKAFAVERDTLFRTYPLHLRPPQNPEALRRVLDLAAAQGVQVILVAPPRSQLAAAVMGETATQALRMHFETLAQQLGLQLFQPDSAWPNEFFIDQAHMNRRGRARFMDELRQWWAQKP